MCIAAIIYSPLKQEYLNEMEKDNPHGGGVAWLGKSRKGNPLLNFARGLKAKEIGEMQEHGLITYPYLLHFRWATHGDRGPGMTHPFPVGRRALNGQLLGHANKVLIHNGIWSGYTQYLELVKAPDHAIKRASDTAIAAYLVGEYPEFEADILKDIPWACAVAELVNGKMEIRRYGDTWQQYSPNHDGKNDGNWYSNLSWLPAKEWFAANKDRWSTNSYRRYNYSSIYEDPTGEYTHYAPTGRRLAPYRSGDREFYNHIVKETVTYDQNWNGFTCADGTRYVFDTQAKKYIKVPPPEPAPTWEALVQTAVMTGENLDKVKEAQDWKDYVRARYGDEVANEMDRDSAIQRASTDLEDHELEVLEDAGLVSEDPAEVNAWLAKEYLRNAS